jgi:Ca-activated chloride channel family protein
VIVLSDGHDRYSTASAEDVLSRVRESDVLVYGISLGQAPSALFGELATLSGGRAFHVTAPTMLASVFQAVARELRTQYLLGYTPPPGPAGWRTIDVQIPRADVRVRARSGYRAR